MYQIKMFLKTLFCVFLCLSEIFGKPQNIGETGKCATFEEDGYSCVEASQCSTSKCDSRLNPRGGNNPDECSQDKHVELLSLDCEFTIKTGIESNVCCHESAVISKEATPPPTPADTNAQCITFQDNGYSCVKDSDCITGKCIKDLRTSGGEDNDQAGPSSEDCKKEKKNANFYHYECDNSPRSTTEPLVCCHKNSTINQKTSESSIISKEDPPSPTPANTNAQCITFHDDGYSCVKDSDCITGKCIKDLRTSGGEDNDQAGPSSEDCKKEKKNVNFYHYECDNSPRSTTEPLVCCHKNSTIQQKTIDSPNENNLGQAPKCGSHILMGYFPRISGSDTTTSFGEWPHMCALFQNGNFIGGATLIAPGVVLTAAHIVNKVEQTSLSVRCGDWDISNNPNEGEILKHQELQVKYAVIHPRFESDLFLANDIALLYTDGNFTLGDIINPACLPTTSDLTEVAAPCIATGWGRTSSDPKETTPSLLKQVVLELKDKTTCENLLADKQGKPYKLDDSAICAGGRINEDTCEGDGGGPLVCRRASTKAENYVLVGITSWGKACGNGTVPGVYAGVGKNLCFIDYITKCLSKENSKGYFDYKNCDSWLSDERVKIDAWVAEAEKKASEKTEIFLEKILAEKSLEKAKKSKERLDAIDNIICGKK